MTGFRLESFIAGNREDLYADLLTMGGVNYELLPVVKMTAPSPWSNTHLSDWPTDTELFTSVILLFGVLPVDWHHFRLSKVHPHGFDECSSSLVNRQWRHSRTIATQGSGCLITDVVSYESKVPLLGWLMKPVYTGIFRHRHRRLVAKYGAGG